MSIRGRKAHMEEAKPLGKITAILADLGLEVTYAYDDLVFVQHSAFLLRFAHDPAEVDLFCHADCNELEADMAVEEIVRSGRAEGFVIRPRGTYTLSQHGDQAIRLEFAHA